MSEQQYQSLQKALMDQMNALSAQTNANIDSLRTEFTTEIASVRTEHSNRLDTIENQIETADSEKKIEELSLQIELLKQEKLRNNLRFTDQKNVI